MAYVPNSNSVVAFQSNPSVLQTLTGLMSTNASVITVGTAAANQSVSGTVGASIIGLPPFVLGGSTNASVITVGGSGPANQSVSGTVGASIIGLTPVSISNFPTSQNVSGSVVAFQGGAPWAQTNVGSIITVAQSSVAVAIVSGSIAVSVAPPANQSVSGTVQTDVRGSVATVIIGGSIAASFTPPANQSVSGTVTANQGTNPWVTTGSVQGVMSVIGTLPVTQSGGWNVSVVSTVPSSVIVGASIFGQLPAGTAMLGSVVTYQGAVWNVAGSVAATVTNTNLNVGGSVVAFQATGWSGSVAATITNTNVNVSGSVTATQVGTWKTSIASNYAAGAGSVISALGNLAFGVRNDTLASVLATSDGQYIPWTVGPAGENIVANAPMNKWVQGTTSVLNQFGVSMITIAAQGTSIFTYITGVQIANMSASSVLVTFSGATSSVIGYTIAPPGGGSNIVLNNGWKTNANGAFTASVSGAASVYITAEGFISKT